MNLKNIYEQYKSINPDLTEEMFNKTYQDFGDEYLTMIDEELKKKDPPNGEEELTPIQGSMATEPTFQQIEMPLPTIPNTNAPNLSVLDTTESPISTASASEIGVSSLEGDYNNLSQHRPVINPDLPISQANPVSNPLGYNSDINGGEDDIKLPIKTYKDYTAELKEISTDLKGVQNKISSYVSQLNNINQSIKEKNEYIQGLNNNPIIKEIESLSMQMKDIDVNNIKSYEEENAIKRYNALVGSAEYRTLAESINKGIGEINALQNQYQSISESEAFKTLNEQEKSIIGKYNGIIGSEAYKQSISEENKRLQAEQKGNSILEEPSNNDVKPSVSKKLFYGVNAEGDTVTISNKNFTKTDKSLVAKDGNTYEIYKREGLSFIETDEGLKLVGNDGDVSKYPLFGKDFEFYKGKLLYNSEKEDSPTDIYKAQRRNFHYVAGGTLSSGLEEKDITGKFISLEDETELYKSYESKGYGNILGIDEYTKRPIFKLNEVGAKALNEENEFSVPSDYDKGKAYAIDQNRVMSEINEGKEIEDNERHRQEKILGRKIAGALLTEEEIKEELVAKRTQQLLSQGYDAQQARQQADREWVGTQLQKQKASNEWIDYIVSEAENNNVVNGKSSKYHQFTNSERETWHSLKDDIDFAEFISSDYVKNKYGTKGGGLEYHFENTKLRKSFLDDYIQYKQKRLSDNRRALNSTRDRQYRMDIRVAMDNGDDTALATAREKRKPIEREYQNIQQKALENSILANKIENGFDIIKKENKKIAEEYAGYQNGRLGDVASYTGKSIINGGGKLITDVVGGFLSLGGMFSDKINSYHTAFNVENSQFFNVLSGNPTDKVTVYKKGDIIVEERLGKMFIKGNDGSLSFSEELTYNPKAFDGFKEVDKYTDENLASWGGMIVNQVAMMYVPSAGGGMLAKVTANSTRLNKIISVSSNVLGKEHLLTKSLVSFSHNSKNIYTSALWAMEVQNQNYHEAKNAGLTRQQAGVYSIIQSGLTGALVHFSPDEKFFKGYNSSQKSIIDLIAKNDWVKLKSYTTDFVKKAIVSSRGELLQENSEVVANNIVNTIFNQVLDEKKLNEWSVDEFIETGKSTLGTTSFLEAINYLTRGGIKTRGLSNIEKMVVASQIPEIQKQLQEVENGVWGSDIKRDAREALQYIAKIQKYTKQIPDDIHLKTSETADLVLSMDKIAEFEKKKNETDYPSIKESYDEKIQAENDKIKNILSGAKKNITNGDSNIEGNKEISQPQNSNIINNEEEQGQNDLPSPVVGVEQPTPTIPQEGADVIEYNGKLYTIQGNDVKDQNGNSVPKKDQATILEQGKIVSNQQQGEQENISEQNIPKQKNEDEEDVDIDFSNSLYTNARIQGNNTPNDGATELGSESLPNTERGQDNPQGVSQTANLGGSETKAEITPNKKELLWESEPSKETTTASPNSHTVLQGSESNVSDANSSNSQDGDTKILPINQNTNIERKPLSEIHTDESRFQGRKKLNETIVNNIANNFSDKDQDPIHIWTDPKDDKTYVLSGHHRYYGAKRAGREDVKVIDRSADFTEEQAIRFAKEEANANRSMETPLERANTLRQKRERGEDTKAFLENEGRNKNLVHNLSYLNPKGKAVQSMQNFEATNESDSKRETEKIADWTGEVMRIFKDYLTPAHENEIYDFLNNKEKSKRFTNKREFVEKVRSLIGLNFDPKQPLNLARVSTKGSQEQEWENEAKRLRDEIAYYEKQITDLDKRFTDPKREDYISPDTKDFQELKEIAREQKTKLKSEQELVYKELDAHNRAKGNYLKADASMGNLFGDVDFNKTPYKKGKITYRAFDKLVEKLQKHFGKAFKKGVNITTDWNEFQKKAEAYRNGKKQKRENEAFNRELNALKAKGKDYPKHFLSLGLPSNILKSIGIPNLNITIGKNTLLNSSQKNNGRYDLSDLKNLPEAINNPLIVFENPSEAHPNRRGLLINLTNGKRNFLAVIQVNDSKDGVDLNNVVSIHPRNFNNFVNWINDKNLLYVDKENASKWLSSPLVETEKQSHSDNAQTTRLIDAKLQNNIDKAIEKVENFENPPIKNDVEYHIGAKARLTYEQQILKNNPNISEEHLQESLDFLHSLEDSKENTKAIKIAVKWLANDTIRLPFAMDNVRKAIALADKHKIDPMKFKSPMDIINKYYVDVEYGKAVNPDNIPEFTNRRVVEYDGGEVVIYDVEDSEAGQIAVVKVAHQHFGWSNESGNSKQPWCLAGFTRTGKPTESARNYWHNTYNSVGKKIAFQNGKPIAFMAHDKSYEGDLWWDLEDQPSNNLPLPNGTYLDPDGEISEKKGGDTDEDLDDYYEDAVQIVADDLADYEFRDIVQWLYEKTAYEGRSDFQTSRIWEDTQSDIQDKAKELLEDEIRYKMDDGEYDDLLEEKINEYKEENGYNEDEELEGYELDEIKDDLRQEILDNYYDYYGLEEIFYEKEAEVKEDELYNYNYTPYQRRMILEDYTRYNDDDSFDLRDTIRTEQERLWSEDGGGYTDIHFMKTPSGVIYGAKLPDGSLYINPEHLNANTPIHEFGHIWEQLMPQRFAKGVELLKNTKAGKELFQELRNNKGYENYSDDRLWNETLVTMLGNRGEELYHSNSASKFVAWVKDFFKALGEYLHKMSGGKIGKELTPDDKMQTFMKGALAEIMGAKEIIPESNVTKKEVPIYLKDMTNAEIRTMLENMNLVVPAKCA